MKRLPGNAEEYDFANLEENEYSPHEGGETMFAPGVLRDLWRSLHGAGRA